MNECLLVMWMVKKGCYTSKMQWHFSSKLLYLFFLDVSCYCHTDKLLCFLIFKVHLPSEHCIQNSNVVMELTHSQEIFIPLLKTVSRFQKFLKLPDWRTFQTRKPLKKYAHISWHKGWSLVKLRRWLHTVWLSNCIYCSSIVWDGFSHIFIVQMLM